MFLGLFRKLDAFLRNTPPRDPWELIPVDDDFWENLHGRRDPLRTKVYWAVYRFFADTVVFHPKRMYDEVKWFLQRGRRGWSDRDTWSLDWYLSEATMLPAALRHLKATKHGTPMSMFPTGAEYVDETGNPTEPAHEIASRRWDETMDKMIAGFDAARRIQDGLYEEELGAYPLRRPEGVSKEDWKKVGDDRFKASRLLEERDMKIFKDGMEAFASNFFSLWD